MKIHHGGSDPACEHTTARARRTGPEKPEANPEHPASALQVDRDPLAGQPEPSRGQWTGQRYRIDRPTSALGGPAGGPARPSLD